MTQINQAMTEDILDQEQCEHAQSFVSSSAPSKSRFRCFVQASEEDSLVSAAPPPHYAHESERSSNMFADSMPRENGPGSNFTFTKEPTAEYPPKTRELYSSTERHGFLMSEHARPQQNHWTISSIFRKLALALTALMLLKVLLASVFGGGGGNETNFIFAPTRSPKDSHLSGTLATHQRFTIRNNTGIFFTQEVRPSVHGKPNVHVRGEIHIKPAQAVLDSSVLIEVVSRPSDPELIHFENLDAADGTITMISPSHFTTSSLIIDKPTIHTQITIWIMPGTVLPTLKISTQTLPIVIHPDLHLHIEGQLNLITTHSSIIFPTSPSPPPPAALPPPPPSIYARETIIETHSGSITGTYPLYDLLSITTHSGSINIDLIPQEISPPAPKPAKLHLHTSSGAITIRAPPITTKIPQRDYQNDITTLSSSIAITLLPHGSFTNLASQSGSITATLFLLPLLPSSSPVPKSNLISNSASGSTLLTLLTLPLPLPGSSSPFPHPHLPPLHSIHKTLSGSLHLTYPFAWEGHISGSTTSGSLRLDWPGTSDIVWGDHHRSVRAQRGDGEGGGVLEFGTGSGRAELVGEGR